MADLPKTLRIGPYIYTVEQNVRKLQDYEREKQSGFSGFCRCSAREIILNEDEPIQNLRETLWHEVQHAILDLFRGQAGDDDKLNGHEWIYATTPLELMVLRDNPGLVAFLTAED